MASLEEMRVFANMKRTWVSDLDRHIQEREKLEQDFVNRQRATSLDAPLRVELQGIETDLLATRSDNNPVGEPILQNAIDSVETKRIAMEGEDV